MYSFIVYRSMTNPYMRLVRVVDGQQWDVAADALAMAATWGNTDIELSSNANVGGIPITIPANLPAGDYDALFYDAASPADSDTVEFGKRVSWTGKQLLGLPIEL